MKAIYTHLQTCEWIISPKGLKYFAIATVVGTPDRAALKKLSPLIASQLFIQFRKQQLTRFLKLIRLSKLRRFLNRF